MIMIYDIIIIWNISSYSFPHSILDNAQAILKQIVLIW